MTRFQPMSISDDEITYKRVIVETAFLFLFLLLSAPATVFCDNITLISTFYNNNNNKAVSVCE